MAGIELLTDKTIQSKLKAAARAAKSQKVNDGGGLVLDVRDTGTAWWRLRYRFAGKEGMISLGTYPEVSLKEARKRRAEAQTQLANGINPSVAKQAAKAAQKAAVDAPGQGSFESVAREWYEIRHQPLVTEGHARRNLVRMQQDLFPFIGARPIDSIDAPTLLQVLRRVEQRGALETAHRVKDLAGQVFRYGIATGVCTRDVSADLREALRPARTRHHASLTEPADVGSLLWAMDEFKGHPVTRCALQLSALLMLRPGELRHMQWAWIDWEARQLRVPSDVMKRTLRDKLTGQPHVVPLARQALAALSELRPLTGGGVLVFPGQTSKDQCLSENTVRTALRRMGYSNEEMTPHGFRAMARTMAAERLGIAPEVIEAQLAHAVPDALGRAYNRTQYLEQRVELMQRWADYLDQLRLQAKRVPTT